MTTHANLANSELHESKGASAATVGQLLRATGAATATFQSPTLALVAPEVLATATEVNRTCDVSTRTVAAGATLTVTEALHDGKTILLNTLAGSVCTLPAATQLGQKYRFVVSVLATSNSHIVKVANASDIIQGSLVIVDQDTAGTVTGFVSGALDDTITLNRSTSGSVTRGEWIELECVATNIWAVSGQLTNTGAGTTPFSATV